MPHGFLLVGNASTMGSYWRASRRERMPLDGNGYRSHAGEDSMKGTYAIPAKQPLVRILLKRQAQATTEHLVAMGERIW